MEGERGVLQDRVEAAAVERRRDRAARTDWTWQDEQEKASAIEACTASTLALSGSGRLLPNSATAAPNSARISTHSSIEPSWLPHMPEIL